MAKEKVSEQSRDWAAWVSGGLLVVFATILVASYYLNFRKYLNESMTNDAAYFGQFGDFIGGILNPLVAFAAFFWLTRSVKIQKKELADTKVALEDAARSQKKQVENGNKSIQIAALTAVVSAGQVLISALEKEVENLERKKNLYEPTLKKYQENLITLNKFTYPNTSELEKAKAAFKESTAKYELFDTLRVEKMEKIEALRAERMNSLEWLRKMAADIPDRTEKE